jgi:hypothetical protein
VPLGPGVAHDQGAPAAATDQPEAEVVADDRSDRRDGDHDRDRVEKLRPA